MTTEADAILTLQQWLSPGFPVGAFAYSHGLEQVIDTGDLRDAETLELWLVDLVAYGGGRADVVLLAAAYRATPGSLPGIDATARAFAASSERLLETVAQGRSFAATVDAIWDTELGALTYPVAVGHAAACRGLPLGLTARMYLHAFAANLISAAVRLVPLGQTEGQAALARLGALIRDTAADAAATNLDDLASHCFAADIAAMRHETQHSRVFRT
ncbi:urease accessory UreF family protein [Sulfitobacter sp. D35]|uniref:urease accessory protein UreF n=1 Tax=Sulfitobacter sp. D35 TaxID=3083252 RepID=UPI00296FDE37|nr:urease accessory UreF family protein [Sulfitobacter sp. D35]MDW4497328.1 urease accessory UreF family protein [Sulfitobacter sp. D35]